MAPQRCQLIGVTSLVTELTGGGRIPGGTGIGSGSYSCGAGSLEFRTPFEPGEGINSFRSA